MGLYVQPPSGVWNSSPERRALFAVLQVKQYIRRTVPEGRKERAWQKKLAGMIGKPVKSFDWTGWYAKNVDGQIFQSKAGDSPDAHQVAFPSSVAVPESILAAWREIPDAVRQLWLEAAEVRTAAEGLPFDSQDLDAALATVGEQIAGITDTLRDQFAGMMRVSIEETEGQFGFAKRLRQEWAHLSKVRSKLIAVTEWNRAASAATHNGYVRQGVQQVIWLTAGDDRVCPTCDDNSAEGAVGINLGFPSGDLYPPAHPGCRCNIAAA